METNDKNNITFVLSDESINSYGFIVLTSGIDTTQFEKNPIMLYMHNRDGNVIGRWENIRKDGTRLLGDAVFDDSTELAAMVKKQVEKGFLRCVSIGIEETSTEVLNGVQTITKCRLIEVSIVDIPSNSNAVKLYRRAGGFYELKDNNSVSNNDLRTSLISLLGLDDNVDDTKILQTIKRLLEGEETVDNIVNDAILYGYIEPEQRNNFCLMAKGNKEAFLAYMDLQRKAQEPEINKLIQEAIGQSKLLACEIGIYHKIGARMGVKTLKELLFTLRSAIKPIDIINSTKDRNNWTLDDYRKFAPKELEINKELYARLVKQETGAKIEARTLDWYRKHNPEYLREHPDVFHELLKKENENKIKNQ